MSFKANNLPRKLGRQTSTQSSFTTDDKDIFTDKRSSVVDSEYEDRVKSRRRSRSIGSSITKWKTLASLDTTKPLDASNLLNESKPGSSSLKFRPIDEDSEDSHINELNIVQSPNQIDENMNLVFRNNGKRFPRVNKESSNLQRKKSYKLSRKLTRRMTTRQKQKLMMESEFDEFDEVDRKKESLSEEGDLSDVSDNEDVDDRLVVHLNMKRLQEEDVSGEVCDDMDIEYSKVQRIADELLATEKSYVKKLHLLDQVFQMNIVMVNRDQALFPKEIIPQMFSNIKSIYQFHHDFLLPKLQQVISPHSADLKVGEVMAWFAPFLKLYIEYVKNFDRASDLVNYWLGKSPKFAQLVEELQKRPECGNLTLQHHMLEPVQRVPRYELLLKDYLKHLPKESADMQHTEKALKIVKEAAQHSNEAMRKIEKFRKLLDLNESLGEIDLISPTRELVKEGRIMRVSAKDGSLIERYIFLFNDLLLVCQSGAIKQHKIKSKMNIDDMEITESHNLETPNCFYVRCREKSIELHTSSYEEKQEWEMTFKGVIEDYESKMKSNRVRMTILFPVVTDQLGKRAPTWVKDNETSMCMRCAVAFSTFRRRHHCRACGLVVCGACSRFRAKLDFSRNLEDRVCCYCYEVLVKNPSSGSGTASSKVTINEASSQGTAKVKSAKMKLQVKAAAPSVFSGYMSISCDRKNWSRRWFAAHSNFILFSFKAHQDVVALTSLPLPGYQVKIADPCEVIQKENMFKVFHEGEKKVYYFQVEDLNHFFRWIEVLQSLSKLVVPPLEENNRTTAIQPI